jgi:proline dehydrogenase
MLRPLLLHLSQQAWLRRQMENSRYFHTFTSRFVAGAALPDGLRVLSKLSAEGICGTLDCLGENVLSLTEAGQSKDAYLAALDGIAERNLPATVSIKLSQFGLGFSEDACLRNVEELAARARDMNSRVEIDMESSAYTDRTLALAARLQERFPGHLRAVIQAYLRRSETDIERLNQLRLPVRLCKGAYQEPPERAFPQKTDVDRNYVRLMKLLLDRGTYPAIASHDERLITAAREHATAIQLAPDQFEFQMLFGIRRGLQRSLVKAGYRVRLYVPYGNAWYPYFMRRLAERPANLLFFIKSAVRD